MNYTSLCDAIARGETAAIEMTLTETIRLTPNDTHPLAYAAHLSLCQGHPQRAKILAEKALALVPDFGPALIESALADLYSGDLERSYRGLQAVSLQDLPASHPAHLAQAILNAMFDEAQPTLKLKAHQMRQNWAAITGAPELIDALISLLEVSGTPTSTPTQSLPTEVLPIRARALIAAGNQLLINLFARLCQLIAPTSPHSFLAVGIIELHQGFLESAGKSLHEAAYRQTGVHPEVLWPTLALFCRQQRFHEAVDVANQLITANAMTLDGMGLYIELLICCHADPSAIRQCLDDTRRFTGAGQHPSIEIASLRVDLYTGTTAPESAIQTLNKNPELTQTGPGLYLSAHLIKASNPELAQSIAEKALHLMPNHPDADNWLRDLQNPHEVVEYMGLFLPSAHEGCAWPNDLQTELLKVIFASHPADIITGWQSFLDNHPLERLDAGCYRLLPLLHSRLTRFCPNADWPRREMLKGVWKKSFLENATRLKSIMALIDIFKRHGIRYRLLKGLANAIGLYGDLGARPMSDIDIVIAPEDLLTCHNFLTERGWQTETAPSAQRLRFQYASTYLHPDGGNLDLHWRPAEDFTTDFYNPSDLGESTQLAWMGQSIETLNPTANLACTILHGVAWNHLSPVRWVSDALLLLQQQDHPIHWDQFESLTQRYRFNHITTAGLQYLVTHFPAIATLIPEHLRNHPLTTSEERLLHIRCRSRTEPADLNDLLVLFESLSIRFKLGPHDQRWVCGNQLSNDDIQTLASHDIHWMPVYDAASLEKQLAAKAVQNCLLLDGNLNGFLRTVSAYSHGL